MTVGRSAVSALVKSKRYCFMGFFVALALPLGLTGSTKSSVAVENQKPAENGSRERGRSSAGPALVSRMVMVDGIKARVRRRRALPRGGDGGRLLTEGMRWWCRRVAAAGRPRI
jgi:hypothetical protein